MILIEIIGDLFLLLLNPIQEYFTKTLVWPLKRLAKRFNIDPKVLARVRRIEQLRRESEAAAAKIRAEELHGYKVKAKHSIGHVDPFPDHRGRRQAAQHQYNDFGSARGLLGSVLDDMEMQRRQRTAQMRAVQEVRILDISDIERLFAENAEPVEAKYKKYTLEDLIGQQEIKQNDPFYTQEINYKQESYDYNHFAKLAVRQGIKNPYPNQSYQVAVQDPDTGEWGTVILPPAKPNK